MDTAWTRLLATLLDLLVVIFAVTSMLSVGFGNPVRRIVEPLRNWRWMAQAMLANFVLVPLLALAVVRLAPLDQPQEAGLILVGMSAGAPFVVKLLEAARGDVARGASLLVVLLPVTVVYAPVAVPQVLPGAEVRTVALAVPLILTMLLPFAVGLMVRERWRKLAKWLVSPARQLSTVALALIVPATVLADVPAIMKMFRDGAVFPALFVIVAAFAVGYLLGGADRNDREAFGFGTSQRNIAAATVMATQSFDDPSTVAMVIVTSLAGFFVLFPAAWLFRRRRSRAR
jgi:predicted Na+-dependent transporter